jgi:hypothetical protein
MVMQTPKINENGGNGNYSLDYVHEFKEKVKKVYAKMREKADEQKLEKGKSKSFKVLEPLQSDELPIKSILEDKDNLMKAWKALKNRNQYFRRKQKQLEEYSNQKCSIDIPSFQNQNHKYATPKKLS